jgi:uroporphyrinogen decarboxylase
MAEMTQRERIRTALQRGVPDRVPMLDITFWPDTIDRWHNEGLPLAVDPCDFLGMDHITQFQFDRTLRLPTRTVEETDEWVISTDSNGATRQRWKHRYAPPGHTEPAIRTREDWERVACNLNADPVRLVEDVNGVRFESTQTIFRLREQMGAYRVIRPDDPVWFTLMMMGFEESLLMFGSDPDLAEDIFATYTRFSLAMCELAVKQGLEFDGMWVFSDLCYRNGMLYSPRFYRERILKYHRQYAEFAHEHGWQMLMHCDGYVGEFIPLLIEAGFDCIQPLEARAGNDIRVLKPRFGKQIAYFGNISADVMSIDRTAIRDEVESKLSVAKPGGGYLYHSDHSINPLISLDNYRYTIDLVRELGKYD